MKNILLKISPILCIIAFLFLACEKDLNIDKLNPYISSNLDLNAASWKTYILNSNTEIPIANPKPTTDPSYLKEIDSLKNKIYPSLTPANKDAIEYWGTGAVYRWNEIARELAAKYNSAPASDKDGKYPVPDAAKPLADPKFPFANPPYAARVFAYLNVAQYDALVVAWNYKNTFGRKAPSKIDPSVKTLLPVSDLSTYPSEDAVVAGASYIILTAMFPGEVPYLDSKLAEAKNSKVWAGLNVPSDVSAGDALGKAVGNKVLAKAKLDGMSASNNQSVTTGMIEAAKSRGIKEPWLSQELPLRPPMLPNYGAVNTWNFDKATMASIRPKMPYTVGSNEWKKEFEELEKINKSQTREQARIANFWADGAGTYTPPGHWTREAANQGYQAKFSEIRMARTMALVSTALMDAGIACWETKYYYYTPRPQQFGLKTSVGLPNFPSYTSGHSTFSSAAATVLSHIFPSEAPKFEALALEASNSRIYGLIHFRIDCELGLTHGKKIGQYAIERANSDGSGL